MKKTELLILIVLFSGAVACNAPRSPKCVGQECLDKDIEGQGLCIVPSDCPTGETCTGGICQPQTGGTCAVNNDCALGMFCNIISRQCVECLDHDHCDLPLVCRADGTCGADSPCSADSQCLPDVCDENLGFCVECVINDDCPGDEVCREHQCRAANNTQPDCISDEQCQPYSQICNSATSTCVDPECNSAQDCAAPLACVNSRCGPCQSAGQCRNGEECNTSTGACVQPSTGCTSNASCPGQYCRLSTGACVECLETAHCDLSETCNVEIGVCLQTSTGCNSNNDCPGEYCLISTGDCVECLSQPHCDEFEACSPTHTCVPAGSGDVGTLCDTSANCNDGLTCLAGLCSRPCIGSGKGGEDDCPIGSACYDFSSGTLDGLRMCVGSSQLDPSVPGQPFDMAPGDSCTEGNGCQTGLCISNMICGRSCGANRDCGVGEVCYAVMDDEGIHTGQHFCLDSDLSVFKAAGESCSEGWECDSGVCVGGCGISGSECNGSHDCWVGCSGTCVDHCRSNADCPYGDACNTWATTATYFEGVFTACTPKFFNGTKTDGSSCTSSSECSSDWCAGGICTTPCGTSADCTGGLSTRKCKPLTIMDNGEPQYSIAFCQ